MSSLLVEASRTMPHPVRQGHSHTSRVQLSVDLDDSVTGEDLVQAAESMLQQADAILEGQTKVLTYNIKESEQCEYLVGEYVKLLERGITGPLGNEEEERQFYNLRDQLTAKGFLPSFANKVNGHWVIPRSVKSRLASMEEFDKPSAEQVKRDEPISPTAEVQQSQQSETVAEPTKDDASSSESNAAAAEPAPAEQAATPSA